MNAYAYEQMFEESDTTKDRLIKATQYLLATYGYESTTTRKITKLANTNLSAISFYFDNKENIVKEAVQAATMKMAEYYKEKADEIRAFLAEPEVDKDRAWELISESLRRRIRRNLNEETGYINIGLVAHENDFPESSQHIMAKVAIQDNELLLAELIDYVSDHKDHFMSVLVARSINAAMMTYLEKPILNEMLGKEAGVDLYDIEKVEKAMHEYFMKSIKAIAES